MNNNYKTIIDAGFNIEIRSQRFSTARIYLTKQGVRTGDWKEFPSGQYNASVLTDKAPNTRAGTPIDEALSWLAKRPQIANAKGTAA